MNIQPVDPQPNPPESAKHSPEKQRNAVNMDLNPERLEISRLELGSPENVMLNLLMSVRISPFPATSLSRILLTLFAKKNCCVHTDAVSKADGKTCHFNTTPCLKSQKGQDIFNSPLHLSCQFYEPGFHIFQDICFQKIKPTASVPLFPSEVQHQAPFPRHFAANLVWALRNVLEVFLQTQIHCAHIPTQCHSGKTRDHIKHLVAGCWLDVGAGVCSVLCQQFHL